MKTENYQVLETPPQATYEVGRIKHPDWPIIIFFARQAPSEHVTVPRGAGALVQRYYDYRKATGLTKPKVRHNVKEAGNYDS